MNRTYALLAAAVVAVSAGAVPKPDHAVRNLGNVRKAARATLRDVLELESYLIEKNPVFFGEGDRARRAQTLTAFLPTLASDSTIPDGVRQRLAALDPNEATTALDATLQARDQWVQQELARGVKAPRASARARMYAAVEQNDVEASGANVFESWQSLGNTAARAQAKPKNTERGMYEMAPKKETF